MKTSIRESRLPVGIAVVLALSICIGATCEGDPPTGGASSVDAGPDQTVNVGDTVMLMGTSTGIATHKWELTSRPAGSSAVIQNERSLTGATFVADQEGEYVATLIGAISNNPTAPDVNPADTDTVTITAVRQMDGGTGGTGGAPDPCVVTLPEPAAGSNLVVHVYAALDTTPVGISFAADDTLFIGTNEPDQVSSVFWVSPGGTTLSESPEQFDDPDAIIVDRDGLFATAGNVLIGGSPDGGSTGQIVEMTPAGRSVGAAFLDPCLRNINHLVFDRDDRLLATNFNNQSANVCAVLGNRANPTVLDLIPDVEGDGPAGLTIQDPNTGDLFVSSEGSVHRYGSDGTLVQANDIVGTAMAYGPLGSPFEGLLVRRSGMLVVRNLATSDETPILTGSVGSFVTFDADANLYISDPPGFRVLRVSLESRNLPPTAVGCP